MLPPFEVGLTIQEISLILSMMSEYGQLGLMLEEDFDSNGYLEGINPIKAKFEGAIQKFLDGVQFKPNDE